MIEQKTFLAGMTALAGCYGREIDGAVQRLYYGVLSPAMTSEEFERAVAVTVATETYWPSPAVLLERAGKAAGETASQALATVVDRLRAYGGYRFFPHEQYQQFDEATKAGIRAVGGLRNITLCEVGRYATLERKFTKAYVEQLRQTPALPRAREPELALGDGRRA